MEFINGITFAPFCHKGVLETKEAKKSLELLVASTGANWIILAPAAVQATAQSETIDFKSEYTPTDEELCETILRIKKMGLSVALNPTVNCLDGTWRAFINFFDNDVPCEPKWDNWFKSHTEFLVHYARIAQQTNCDMFITGCEMVMTQRRSDNWRALLLAVRNEYKGLVSYNTDKYQEEHVSWWDAVDVISSSGYYPIDDWEQELDRIEYTVKKYGKPFFFAESGCMSAENSCLVPNNWGLAGAVNLTQQKQWYEAMFEACLKREWVEGFGLWDWPAKLYELEKACEDRAYSVFGKPAQQVIYQAYQKNK